MKASKDESNQANDQTKGHVASNLNDPHTSVSTGSTIGLTTNFGIEHYGFIKDSEGLNQTK